jgi:hypothetical protein
MYTYVFRMVSFRLGSSDYNFVCISHLQHTCRWSYVWRDKFYILCLFSFNEHINCWMQGSSVSVVIRLQAGRPRFDSWRRHRRNSFLRHRVQTGSGLHPASYLMGTGGSFAGNKAAGSWSWQLTPSSAEVKNSWSYTSTPTYVFIAWCLVKYVDKIYLSSQVLNGVRWNGWE